MDERLPPAPTEPPRVPRPDVERVAPFWAAACEGRLAFPCCQACGRFNWYPTPACQACGAGQFVWTQVTAAPRVFTWTVARRALDPRLTPLVPFIPLIVEFADASGVRLVTRLVDSCPDELEIGKTGRMVFLDLGYPAVRTGIIAPLFAID